MRLFIGVWLSEEMKQEVVYYIDQLQRDCSGFKWSSSDNLHFTLKFLGEVSGNKLESLSQALKYAAAEIKPFRLTLGTVGSFPAKGIPRILWLDVNQGKAELVKLAESVEKSCLNKGFDKNDKPFKAHLTIARAKNEQSGINFSKKPYLFESQTLITGFSLIESCLYPTGPIYHTLENYIFI